MKFSFALVSFLGCLAVCHADAVRLQVVGPDGKPVAGAKVHVVESSGASWRVRKTETPLDLQSDAAGKIAFDSKNALPDPKDKKAPSLVYLLAQVKAAGLTIEQAALKAGDNTITLHKGKAMSGVVLGEDEKPLAGIKIRLRSVFRKGEDEDRRVYFPDDGANLLSPQSISDAEGKWSFDGLPLEGSAQISIADPRFKNETFTVDVAQGAPPIFLERGATIKGRLLRPDGTPAGGVKFYAGDFGNQPTTKADGTFEVGGLGEKSVYLQVLSFDNENKLSFIMPPKSVGNLKPGETRDIGDWKAEAGTHVKGHVVEEGTKKPISGASLQLWGGGQGGDGQSDKTGAFDFLSSPDNSSLSVRADGFVAHQNQNVPDPKNGVIDLGTITLKRGQKITGVVKNEAGTPQSISLYADKNDDRVYARSNESDGKFVFNGLAEGNYTIKSDEFKVVSGNKFSVGATTPAALSVVVEGKQKASTASKVEGRVSDEADQPVAGAKIKLRIRGAGGSYSNQTTISNLDGTYSAPFSMQNATPKVTGVTRPGFIFGTSALKEENGVWRGDIALQKRGSVLKGRVVDAQGQPVARAFVGLSTGYDLPVATDETGTFLLKDAPTRGVTLLASDGPRLASVALEKAGDVVITLPDAAPIEDRAAFADEVLSRSRLGYEWESKWDVLGEKRIEDAFIRAGTDQWSWRGFMQTLAEREPATLLAREAELRDKTPQGDRAGFERVLMLARASSTNEVERAKVKDWLAAQEAEKREISAASVTQLLKLAQVAAKLDPKTGAMWLDYAAQLAAQLPGSGGGNSWEWGVLAASISPDVPQLLIEDWSPSAALQLLGAAMGAYAKKGDIASARKTFAIMEQLAQKPAQTPDKDVRVEGYRQKPKDLLNQGREQLARTLAVSDPNAALEVAKPLDDWQRSQVLIVVAKNAVKLQQPDVARRALNAVFEVNSGNVEFFSQAAGVAQTFDAALADDLFARALAKAIPKDESYERWTPSLAAFAQERAAKWPGQSRILIEREWVTRVETAKKPANDYDPNGPAMKSLVGAMARVAPRRALEMAEQVTEKQNLRSEARGDIAVALLAKQ